MTIVSTFTKSMHSPQTNILIRAVLQDRILAAKASIALGANVMVRGLHNDTLLHVCKSPAMGNLLLRAGTKIDALNDLHQTPLHSSMRRGLLQLSMLLIENGAPLNVQEKNGTTPLHLAQSPQINEALLVLGAKPDVQNKQGDTPLLLALRGKGSPVVEKLMQAGANQFIKNLNGHNAQDELQLRQVRVQKEMAAMDTALQIGPVYLKTAHGIEKLHKQSSYLPIFKTQKQSAVISNTTLPAKIQTSMLKCPH